LQRSATKTSSPLLQSKERVIEQSLGVAESRYDKLIVRAQTSENDLFDFDTELEHLQILEA
jgi:hypothetical protein